MVDETSSDPNINKSFWYFKSKQYGEREAWRAREEGLDVIIVCPSTILGAGWWDDEPNSLFREVYNGLKFYTSATNGFVDVRDVASCMHLLMYSDVTGEKFILSSENVSFREVIWQMADEMKVKRPSIEPGKDLLEIAWRAETIKSLVTKKRPLITKESAKLANLNFSYSNEKTVRTLNYNFKPVKETIAETANIYIESIKAKKEFGVFEKLYA
jgi:nucleoside-diphosphate-sugar epimerase